MPVGRVESRPSRMNPQVSHAPRDTRYETALPLATISLKLGRPQKASKQVNCPKRRLDLRRVPPKWQLNTPRKGQSSRFAQRRVSPWWELASSPVTLLAASDHPQQLEDRRRLAAMDHPTRRPCAEKPRLTISRTGRVITAYSSSIALHREQAQRLRLQTIGALPRPGSSRYARRCEAARVPVATRATVPHRDAALPARRLLPFSIRRCGSVGRIGGTKGCAR